MRERVSFYFETFGYLLEIKCGTEGSKLSLYADDMLLYKTISSDADYISLQQGIDLIHGWSRLNC